MKANDEKYHQRLGHTRRESNRLREVKHTLTDRRRLSALWIFGKIGMTRPAVQKVGMTKPK
jgi:hypothetical protein